MWQADTRELAGQYDILCRTSTITTRCWLAQGMWVNHKRLELGWSYTSFVVYNHDRLTFSGTPESFQMRIDAAKQTTPIGPSVRMPSSNKRVKSNPCRQEGATIGPKAFSSTEQSNMAVGNLGRCLCAEMPR